MWKRLAGMMMAGWLLALAGLAAAPALRAQEQEPAQQEDTRELVKLPAMMRQHMLRNMRDHLVSLNAILEALSKGDVDKAGDIAEKRLGMSSLSRHGAAHLAQFMPQGMRAIGTRMHHAASRFVQVAQEAELKADKEALHATYGALKELTDNCIACHAAYRLR